jgi:hypothetical protein
MEPDTGYETPRIDHLGIVALTINMGLAKLIYALAEHQLCLLLAQNNQTLTDQKGKPTQQPTIRWVFQVSKGICMLSIWENGQRTTRQVLDLHSVHQQIIRPFGTQVCKGYLLDFAV